MCEVVVHDQQLRVCWRQQADEPLEPMKEKSAVDVKRLCDGADRSGRGVFHPLELAVGASKEVHWRHGVTIRVDAPHDNDVIAIRGSLNVRWVFFRADHALVESSLEAHACFVAVPHLRRLVRQADLLDCDLQAFVVVADSIFGWRLGALHVEDLYFSVGDHVVMLLDPSLDPLLVRKRVGNWSLRGCKNRFSNKKAQL